MHIAILSSGGGWHVRDLSRAAGIHGHTTEIIDFRRITSGIAVRFDAFSRCDAILVRTMPPGSLEQVVFRMDVLHRLQAAGKRILNPPLALEACIDKYLASARLAAAGLRVPATIACQDAESALEAFQILGSDVVVKPLFGSEGRGLVRINDPELAWRTFKTLERTQAVLYLQQFIRHPGWDLRVFTIGGRVVASMRRHARKGWRTNVAQGGRAEAVSASAAEERLALAAAAAVGAVAAGVDLLPGPDGELHVLEVNAVPGWRALAPVTGVDIASELIDALICCPEIGGHCGAKP
jgi:ribosomal protein S6--L-glutamate ligase